MFIHCSLMNKVTCNLLIRDANCYFNWTSPSWSQQMKGNVIWRIGSCLIIKNLTNEGGELLVVEVRVREDQRLRVV